jgi:hypothetical protein
MIELSEARCYCLTPWAEDYNEYVVTREMQQLQEKRMARPYLALKM